MRECVCVCVCYMYTCMYINIYYADIHVYTHKDLCMYTHTLKCQLHIDTYLLLFLYIDVYTQVCMYIYNISVLPSPQLSTVFVL